MLPISLTRNSMLILLAFEIKGENVNISRRNHTNENMKTSDIYHTSYHVFSTEP